MPKPAARPYPTVEERVERGLVARQRVPLKSHAAFKPAPIRPNPVDILQQQATSRVTELVPIRYGRMSLTPFTFYRGGAAIMSNDLANTPDTGIEVQACGDAHLSNFGIFSAPDRRLVFDINDFDETLPGPWEWDVKRLAASFVIAASQNGFSEKQRAKVVANLMLQYRLAMAKFAAMKNLEVWYARIDVDELLSQWQQLRASSNINKGDLKRVQKARNKAASRDSISAFTKLTEVVDGEPQFASQPPLLVPLRELLTEDVEAGVEQMLRDALHEYRDTLPAERRPLIDGLRMADMAHKVVGVGSVGTRAWVILMYGRDDNDPVILQVKEAQRSVLEPYMKPSEYENSGERVVVGQLRMQAASDIFLGWARLERGLDGKSRDFYVRQLRDQKWSAVISDMDTKRLFHYSTLCAITLARAHARTGDRIAISSYLGDDDTFDKAIGEFSERYAKQNARDYAVLTAAIDDGTIVARNDL